MKENQNVPSAPRYQSLARHLTRLAGLALLLGAGCGDAPAEDVESTSSALTSWGFFNNAGNLSSVPGGLDVGEGIACKVFPYPDLNTQTYRADMVICFLAPDLTGQGEGQRVNWMSPDANGYPSIPGGDVKAISVSAPKPQDAAVFMLGSDNKVRVSTGSTTVPFFTAGNFASVREYMSDVSDTGARLCLKHISTIVLPSRYAPSRAFVALSCAGSLYVKGTNAQNQWVWKAAANAGAPWNALPAGNTWLEVSHGPMGAYLLSSTNKVLLMATGTANIDGSVTWVSPTWLPRTGLNAELTIKHIGGPFVMGDVANDLCNSTACAYDSLRVWRWDGTRYIRTPGIGSSTTGGSNPWGYIVDGFPYQRKTNAYTLLNNYAWRMYMVTPQ